MFEFKYVELMNWAYWPTVNLPLEQRTIMITGPNGSGKTTFLDALRVLLRAPRLSSNRRFTDYIIGKVDTVVIRGEVTNDAFGRDHRPFEFKGFDCEEVTLAAILKKKSGRWERRYVIAENDISLDDIKQFIPEVVNHLKEKHIIQRLPFMDCRPNVPLIITKMVMVLKRCRFGNKKRREQFFETQ